LASVRLDGSRAFGASAPLVIAARRRSQMRMYAG
jgi:hypothetical protein